MASVTLCAPKCCPDTLDANSVDRACRGFKHLLMMCCCRSGTKQDGDKQELIMNEHGNSTVDPARSSVGDQTSTNSIVNNSTVNPRTSVGDQPSTDNTINNNTIINARNLHIHWWPSLPLPPPPALLVPPPPPPPPPPTPAPCLPLSLSPPPDSVQPESIRNISASTLRVAHSENSQYRAWRRDPRFEKVAELLRVWWFDIVATMKLADLSRSTTYAAYFIFKINADTSLGLNKSQQAIVSLRDSGGETYSYQRKLVCLDPQNNPTQSRVRTPAMRPDGWMELELGQFYFDDGADDQEEVELGFEDKNATYPKQGLIYAGIEVRPI